MGEGDVAAAQRPVKVVRAEGLCATSKGLHGKSLIGHVEGRFTVSPDACRVVRGWSAYRQRGGVATFAVVTGPQGLSAAEDAAREFGLVTPEIDMVCYLCETFGARALRDLTEVDTLVIAHRRQTLAPDDGVLRVVNLVVVLNGDRVHMKTMASDSPVREDGKTVGFLFAEP